MICLMTERWIRPGAYDAFRAAWLPDRHPDPLVRAFHLRDLADPDHVVSFGFLDLDPGGWAALRADPAMAAVQSARMAAMAEHVERTGLDAVFAVAEEVPGPAA